MEVQHFHVSCSAFTCLVVLRDGLISVLSAPYVLRFCGRRPEYLNRWIKRTQLEDPVWTRIDMEYPKLNADVESLPVSRREALADNLTFWTLLEHVTNAESASELDQTARRSVERFKAGKITRRQFNELREVGKRRRAEIQGTGPGDSSC